MSNLRKIGVLALLLMVAGMSRVAIARGPAVMRAQVDTGPSEPALPYIAGDKIIGGGVAQGRPLGGEVAGGLMGWLSPAAVSSPDGSILYNTWKDLVQIDPRESLSKQGVAFGDAVGRPSIRLRGPDGADSLFEEGAFSVAWRDDGTVAYFKGANQDFRVGLPYQGEILVRGALDAPPAPWTTVVDDYIVLGWADDILLAYRRAGEGVLQLLALDGPGMPPRVLAEPANLIAISPDGLQVAVTEGASLEQLSVIQVSTGERISQLDLESTTDPSTGAPIEWLLYAGSWQNDKILAEGASGFIEFSASGSNLGISRVLNLEKEMFPLGVHEPQLLPDGRIAAWAPLPGDAGHPRLHAYLICSLDNGHCSRGPTRVERTLHPIYNPSR